MCQLQGEIWAVAAPSSLVTKTAVDEMSPDGFECQPRRAIDVRSQLLPHVETARVEISDGPDHRRIEASNVRRTCRYDCLPETSLLLLGQHPTDRIGGCSSYLAINGPQFLLLRRVQPLCQLRGLPQASDSPEVVPKVGFILVAQMLGALHPL